MSTITTEQAFSTIKVVKIRLCNKVDNEFLAHNLVIYIEKEIANIFN